MIYYNRMKEEWNDEFDEKFRVPMTPEGNYGDLDFEFYSQEEFWGWADNNIVDKLEQIV